MGIEQFLISGPSYGKMDFPMGMTVRELKEVIKDWPEVDDMGEDREVWFEYGSYDHGYTTAPVKRIDILNLRRDDDGVVSSDILFV